MRISVRFTVAGEISQLQEHIGNAACTIYQRISIRSMNHAEVRAKTGDIHCFGNESWNEYENFIHNFQSYKAKYSRNQLHVGRLIACTIDYKQ